MVSTEATASMAPAAARPWPVTPLVEVTGGPGVAEDLVDGPRLGQVVERGGRAVGVDVADVGRLQLPASNRASSMQDTAPAPSGAGAVMWWASAVLAAPATSA